MCRPLLRASLAFSRQIRHLVALSVYRWCLDALSYMFVEVTLHLITHLLKLITPLVSHSLQHFLYGFFLTSAYMYFLFHLLKPFLCLTLRLSDLLVDLVETLVPCELRPSIDISLLGLAWLPKLKAKLNNSCDVLRPRMAVNFLFWHNLAFYHFMLFLLGFYNLMRAYFLSN